MELYKHCPTCGTANSPTELLCTRCFGDISGITPVAPAVTNLQETSPLVRLLLPDGRQIDLCSGETVGRAGAGGQLFREYPAVSRNHARFVYTDGSWQVTDLDSTNGTFLDGKRLLPDHPAGLTDGQELRFGSAFRAVVRIG